MARDLLADGGLLLSIICTNLQTNNNKSNNEDSQTTKGYYKCVGNLLIDRNKQTVTPAFYGLQAKTSKTHVETCEESSRTSCLTFAVVSRTFSANKSSKSNQQLEGCDGQWVYFCEFVGKFVDSS